MQFQSSMNRQLLAVGDDQGTVHVMEVPRILRRASAAERVALIEKARDELEVLAVCHAQMRQRRLPMRIVDAEWRFDRQKLTVRRSAPRPVSGLSPQSPLSGILSCGPLH